jgi:hypothetical protein
MLQSRRGFLIGAGIRAAFGQWLAAENSAGSFRHVNDQRHQRRHRALALIDRHRQASRPWIRGKAFEGDAPAQSSAKRPRGRRRPHLKRK